MASAIRIVKNTTPSPIPLDDLNEVVPASGKIDLGANHTLVELAASTELANRLASGNLLLNVIGMQDDDNNIGFPRSVDIIRQSTQQFQATYDGKLIVAATPKPGNTTFHLTSRTDSSAGGTGDLLHIDHTVFQFGQDTQGIDQPCGLFVDNGGGNEYSQYWLNTQYVDFDVLGNRTFIFSGGLAWTDLNDSGNSGLVSVTVDAVSCPFDPTPYEVTPGTGNSVISNGYLMVPMPGLTGGTHNLPLGQTPAQTPQPFMFTAVPPSVMDGTFAAPLFWSIDYDLVNEEFFNLLPLADPFNSVQNIDTGDPNIIRYVGHIFTLEVPLNTFVKDLLLIGESGGFFDLGVVDATEIGYGMKLRLDTKTIVNSVHVNVPWSLTSYIKTYRENTV